MGRYVLCYKVASLYDHEPYDLDECEYFSDKEYMDKKVTELEIEYKERLFISLSAYLQEEYNKAT